ncbi:hypothetical protein [Catenuloplanes indicus]|uniref:Tetratricopeptide (TPR) repeat protein n=1 Tax=Catenuloplanes indicus TaxID=137267 RepID=A0AAE4AYN1_9ACTN|nr:hypothetical protein [Catenuloplanes indicus]MDQ0366931.1 tetratricopeptide (TPR) repeat protein [Catenuloplanes indicus]
MMADLALPGYEGLDRETARCFRLLVCHPGPDLSVDAAAAIVGCTPRTAARRCAQLVAAGLAAAAPAGDGMPARYGVPAEIGQQACAIADTAADRDELRARLAQWYLAGAHTADTVLTPWRRRDRIRITGLPADVVRLPSYDAALEWLEAEQDSLAAVVTGLAGRQPLLAWQIADAMWPLYLLRGTPVLRRRLEQTALDCAEQLADPRRIAQALLRYGETLHAQGEQTQALALLRASRDAATRSHDMWGIAAATEAMAMTANSMGAHDEAYYLLTPQRLVFRSLHDLRRAALTELHLAAVHRARGELDQALAALTAAETLLDAPGTPADPYARALVQIAHGEILIARGDHDTARELLVGALVTTTTLHALSGQAQALRHLGELALAQGDTALALTRLHAAVRLFTAHGSHHEAGAVNALIAAASRTRRHPTRRRD